MPVEAEGEEGRKGRRRCREWRMRRGGEGATKEETTTTTGRHAERPVWGERPARKEGPVRGQGLACRQTPKAQKSVGEEEGRAMFGA